MWLSVLLLIATVCVFTRVVTGTQANFAPLSNGTKSRPPPVLPYWIPWLGHTLSFGTGSLSWLRKVFNGKRSGIISLRILGSTHSVIVSPSLTREVLSRANVPIDTEELVQYTLKNFFGDRGTTKKLINSPSGDTYWKEYHRNLRAINHEPFVGTATARTTRAVAKQIWNLISGSESWVDQEPWERGARVEIVSNTTIDTPFVAEADLHLLLRDWVAQIAITQLLGRAFLEANPSVLQDMWLMDSKMNQFFIGLPSFLVPGLLPAYFARERFIAAVAEHHDAMLKVLEGKDPGTKYDDLSDVAEIVWDRVKIHKDAGARSRTTAVSDMALVWAMNANSNQMVFWTILYIYSDHALLTAIRQELAPHVNFSEQESNGLPITEAPRLNIDLSAVMNLAPLLKGTFYEAMRLEVAPFIYREINEDFQITESAEDARLHGKSHPETYQLKKGDMLFIPAMLHQEDPNYFPEPEKFNPRRFWVYGEDRKNNNDNTTTTTTTTTTNTAATNKSKFESHQPIPTPLPTVEVKTLRSFGGGKNMCKGRNFAEREVMVMVAAIVMTWEMEPVVPAAGSGNLIKPKETPAAAAGNGKGNWKHPGHTFAIGAAKPNSDIRVRMWRRKL